MIRLRKIQKMLASDLTSNGWNWTSTWKSDREASILTEFWTVTSSWSPSGLTLYIGFENWDVYESVGISTKMPVPGEKNDWIHTVVLLKQWDVQYADMVERINQLRIEDSDTSTGTEST